MLAFLWNTFLKIMENNKLVMIFGVTQINRFHLQEGTR